MSSVMNFFSGIEGDSHFQACIDADARHVLTSYLQWWDKGPAVREKVKLRKQANPQIHFMIDSGAHTFITDTDKFMHWSRDDFEEYVKGYCEWLWDNREYIFAAVELDIDLALNRIFANGDPNSVVGPAIVEEWQRKYFIPLQDKGMNIIFVWHVERKLEGWEDMCKAFSYVGLPGYMSKQTDFNKFISVARRYMTRIHGFAATKQSDFRDWPWFSIDSITWKTGEMYGTMIHWDKRRQKIIFEQDKTKRHLYRSAIESFGLNANSIIDDTDYKEVTRYSLCSMRAMEAFYEQKYSTRTYYHELRMPQPESCIRKSIVPLSEIRHRWALTLPDDRFKHHTGKQSPANMRRFLAAISCIQNRKTYLLETTPAFIGFMVQYFPKLIVAGQVVDENAFQRELAIFLAPPNPPVQKREDKEHYIPTNNVPRQRVASDFEIADLLFDPEEGPQFEMIELEIKEE